MKSFLKIFSFICKNNSLFEIPKFLAIALIYQIFKRITKQIISYPLKNGKNIFLFPNCNISTMFTYTEIPDSKEIAYLRDKIQDSKNVVFLDIGANIGSYCILLSDILESENIIAFEPHPITHRRIKLNFLLNNINTSQIHKIALSDKCGMVSFSDTTSLSTNRILKEDLDQSLVIESQTLDNFAKNNLDITNNYILKIDVEGFEKEVLKGGIIFFKDYKIIGICFECFSFDDDFKNLLKKYGFNKIKKISSNNYIAEKRKINL